MTIELLNDAIAKINERIQGRNFTPSDMSLLVYLNVSRRVLDDNSLDQEKRVAILTACEVINELY